MTDRDPLERLIGIVGIAQTRLSPPLTMLTVLTQTPLQAST
jgi:hypothetical protein